MTVLSFPSRRTGQVEAGPLEVEELETVPIEAAEVIETKPSRRERRRAENLVLPTPPDDFELYQYFGKQLRWPFVVLFLSQLSLIYGFTMVMKKSPDTWLGFIFLTVMLPPVVVNTWLRVRKRRLESWDHLDLLARTTLPADVSIDVFLPVCGEDVRVLHNTFRHVAALQWPGRLEVHVLDDGDSPTVRWAANHFGFHYVVRPNRGEWKKAGNLIHAFGRTAGDFIVVFDADFAPRPDFLHHTWPYMQEPTTGVVQTAQYFSVADQRVNFIGRYAGTLQEMFFRWIQPARDTCEAAICAGTNVMYRRAAVEAAGGFAQVPIGEDVHSGVKIWGAGFSTRYVPLCLAKGLAPDTWEALTNQQYRWCRSSMLLMVSAFFQRAPFGRRQRLCFWAAFLYYLSSASVPITSVAPSLIMLWLHPREIHLHNYLPFLPSVFATFLVFPRVARGWRWGIYRVVTVNSFCHLFAVRDALRDRVEAWVPTGAAGRVRAGSTRPLPARIARALRVWLVATQAAMWAGVVHALHTDTWLALSPIVVLTAVQAVLLGPYLWRLTPRARRHGETEVVLTDPILSLAGIEAAVV